MSYPFWTGNQAYNVGDIVNSNPPAANGAFVFRCKVAGTSAPNKPDDATDEINVNQPNFPLVLFETVVDNTVTWETVSAVYDELYKLEPDAIIELFHLQFTAATNGLDDNLYFHAGTNGIPTSIVFGGITYTAAPVEADGFEKTGKGTLPRPTLQVANVNNAITSLMHRATNPIDPLMAKVTRIKTMKKFIDAVNFFDQVYIYQDGNTAVTQGNDTLVLAAHGTGDETARFPDEVWYIDRISSENQQAVEFELASKLELTNVLLPGRTVVEHCPYRYRGPDCGYEGGPVATEADVATSNASEDRCGKKVSSCRLRFANTTLPFGGFPGARIHD
jgi:phage-related protein